MGIGDWGLGIGDWGLGPIPNPPIPMKRNIKKYFRLKLKYKKKLIIILIINFIIN